MQSAQVGYDIVGNYMPEARFKVITATVLAISLIIGIIMSNIGKKRISKLLKLLKKILFSLTNALLG